MTGEKFTLGASVLAAVSASLCCIGPLAAVLLGVGSFGAAARFATWRPYLLGLTIVLLAVGFYLTYREREVTCDDGACRVSGAPRRNKLLLWFATVAVFLFAAFPYYSPALVEALNQNAENAEPRAEESLPNGNSSHGNPVTTRLDAQASTTEVEPVKVTIEIDGMTCEACAVTVRRALKRVDGVKSVDVSWRKGRAIVKYEPSKVTPEQLVEAINQTGYRARL
ncbi:MAG: cation transporter [Acidobacteria bacterium]|nr:cation transporter [Acidobacteriota bacterium]